MVDVVKQVTSHKWFPYAVVGLGALAVGWYLGATLGVPAVARINPIPVYQTPQLPITYRQEIGRMYPSPGWSPSTPHF